MNVVVTTEKRDLLGKKVGSLRRKALVPSVIYNAKGESQAIQIAKGDVLKLLINATKTTIVDVKVGDVVNKAIIKEVQRNPITDNVTHISFFQIDAENEMAFEIPFVIVGVSPSVKNNMGILVEVNSTVHVRCKVKDLIPSIEVDISKLELPGQTIQVKDLDLPETIKLFHEADENMTVVTITSVQKQIEAEEAAVTTEAVPVEGAEGAEKKEDGAATPSESAAK